MSAKGTTPRYWTSEDVELLKKLYLRGDPIRDIAKKLDRSENIVYNKAKFIGIGRRHLPAYNRVLFSAKEEAFIRENFHKLTNPEIAESLGKKLTVVRNKCRQMGLLHMEQEYWTGDQVEYLKKHFQMKGDVELAEYFNSVVTWKKKKGWTKKHIEKKRRYLFLKRTLEEQLQIKNRNISQGRFSVSHWKRWVNLVAPIGDIRTWTNQDGHKFKVIKTENGFVHLAPQLYRIHHGKIKKNHMITFKDGNSLNCDIENLEQVTRQQFAKKNLTSDHILKRSDKYLAGIMSPKDKDLRKLLLQQPDLLELKRIQLKLNQTIYEQRTRNTGAEQA